MIYGSHARSQPEHYGRVSGITRIMKDCANAHSRRSSSSLYAVSVCIFHSSCAFGRTQYARYRKISQVMPGHLICAEGESVGRVDRRSVADRDNDIDRWIVRDGVRSLINVSDEATMLYVREGVGVIFLVARWGGSWSQLIDR